MPVATACRPFFTAAAWWATALIVASGLQACKTAPGGGSKTADAEAAATGPAQCSGTVTPAAGYALPPGLTASPATCSEILGRFPTQFTSANPEDTRVICPFLRLVSRSGEWTNDIQKLVKTVDTHLVLPVLLTSVPAKATEFGCDGGACLFIAATVASDQVKSHVAPPLLVDIGQLAQAKGSAHDCGFNFSLGDTAVNPVTRASTLVRLKQLADARGGQLLYQDLVTMKKERCAADFALFTANPALPHSNQINATNDSFIPDQHDQTETALIYSYIGGADNGYVTYADIEALFTGQIPANRSAYSLNAAMLNYSKSVGQSMW